MTLFRPFIRMVAATIGIAALPCDAQQAETFALQFMTFPMTIEPLKVELLIGEGKTMELNVPSNELGPIVRVPRISNLVFGETVTKPDGKEEFKVYGRAPSLAAPKQLVLLLRKGTEMSEGFEVRCISSDIASFDGGKILFVNAAKVDIGGTAGTVKFALKPGAHTIVKPGLQPNGRLSHVKLYYNKNGSATPFFSSMWPVAKHYRGLVFLYHDPNSANQIRIHSFRHFLEADG